MSRYFLNTPMLRDFDDVEKFAAALGTLAIRGYTGPGRHAPSDAGNNGRRSG
jgi:hypothetical protein